MRARARTKRSHTLEPWQAGRQTNTHTRTESSHVLGAHETARPPARTSVTRGPMTRCVETTARIHTQSLCTTYERPSASRQIACHRKHTLPIRRQRRRLMLLLLRLFDGDMQARPGAIARRCQSTYVLVKCSRCKVACLHVRELMRL